MINIADIKKITQLLNPITSPDYVKGRGVDFHNEGLFSEQIFGPVDSPTRRETFSYIELNCKIIHPALVKPLHRLNRKIIQTVNREASFKLVDGVLVVDDDGDINGITSIIKNFEMLMSRVEDSTLRHDMKNMIMNYWKNDMLFINQCLVIPAFYRDAEIDEVHGGLRIKPINDYYVKILRQSIQLESLSVTSGAMYDILAAKMQQLNDELYDYIVKKISKKQGMIRQNILGKRLDFTGGAVITGASNEIKVDEIGIPLMMLVKLFEPFIIYDIHNSGNVNQEKFVEFLKDYNGDSFGIPSTKRLLGNIARGFEIPDNLMDMIKAIVVRVILDKVVVAKRDPALHAESVQAFKPVMVDGNTIKLNILKCSAYNADFDGDRMAIYVPVTKEAIEEAKEKMITSTSRDGMYRIADDFSKDVVIGLYALTQSPKGDKAPLKIKDDRELEKLNPLTRVEYDGKITTVGRILFNQIVPSVKYQISGPVDKKLINKMAKDVYNEYNSKNMTKYVDFCHDVVTLGMKYYTIMAPSFTLTDLMDIPDSITKMKSELIKAKTPAEASVVADKMTKALQKYVEKKGTNIGVIGKAGGLKNGYSQARQILVSKGLIVDPKGDIRIIKNSYGDGFDSDEFFETGYGSRKGIIDRVINTAETGYLSRQLVFALQRVEADPRIHDCKTKRFMTIKVTSDIARRLSGRYIINDDLKLESFDAKKHTGKIIHLRSPLYCLTPNICNACYGDLLLRNKSRYVGILAAQVCGERLTQTIMRTFHVGGSVSIKTINVMDELGRILEPMHKNILLKNFKQEKSKLIALSDGKIEIRISDYLDAKKDIIISKDDMVLNYAYFKLFYGGVDLDVVIDNKIEIDLKDKELKKTDDGYIIQYSAGDVVFDCIPTSEAFSEQVKMIQALFSGNVPYKNSDHFLMKIYDQYMTLNTDTDLIHLEILASNLLRDKGNPSYPARLNPSYNPIAKSLKSIPRLESWLQALAFEDPKNSITTGLIYDKPTDETILEKIVTGGF